MRIAIVGAAVSGLVTAHLLHRTHDITVFEAGAYAGGHTNTVAVETEAGVHHVDTHIFPNGCLPSVEVIARCLARRTDLRLTHFEDFGLDYAETLRRWRANLDSERLEQLGYDERFRRLWRLYLCYCEAGFAERRIGVAQALLAKPRWSAQRQRVSSQMSLPPYSAAASSTSVGAGTQAS